jgi:hypothetical protein
MSATLTPSPTDSAAPVTDTESRCDGTCPRTADLGRYRDGEGRERILIARPAVGGSLLVIDQDAATLADRRLVAHLAAEEPVVNARIVAQLYLADPRGRFARPFDDRDWVTLADGREPPDVPEAAAPGELRDPRGRRYRLGAVDEHR